MAISPRELHVLDDIQKLEEFIDTAIQTGNYSLLENYVYVKVPTALYKAVLPEHYAALKRRYIDTGWRAMSLPEKLDLDTRDHIYVGLQF